MLIHTLVFAPDGVSTAHLMSDLAVELHRCGHEVTVLTSTPHYNPDSAASARQPIRPLLGKLLGRSDFHGIPIFHVHVARKRNKVWLRALDYLSFHALSLVTSSFVVPEVDIIVAPSPPLSMGAMSWLYGVLHGIPSIYNVQEIYPDCLVNQGVINRGCLYRALQMLEAFVYARNRFLVTISEEFAATLRARGVRNDRLAVIPNFVDTRRFRPLPRDNPFSRHHGLVNCFTVLYAGNLGLTQDFETVLDAARVLCDEPVQFVFVGDGIRRTWLEREVERRGLSKVRILNHQPRDLMPQIHASSDVEIIPLKPTTALDTFPSKIYTILACGKPVIAMAESSSGLAKLVEQASCGEVVAPQDPRSLADAIRRALADPTRLGRAGELGRQFVVDRYAHTQAGTAYSDVIRDLIEHGTRSEPDLGFEGS